NGPNASISSRDGPLASPQGGTAPADPSRPLAPAPCGGGCISRHDRPPHWGMVPTRKRTNGSFAPEIASESSAEGFRYGAAVVRARLSILGQQHAIGAVGRRTLDLAGLVRKNVVAVRPAEGRRLPTDVPVAVQDVHPVPLVVAADRLLHLAGGRRGRDHGHVAPVRGVL